MSVGSPDQLRALVALRWRMVRSRRSRRGFVALAALVPVLCVSAAVAGSLAPRDRSFDVLVLAPTAYLSVAVLLVLAPLVAGGGNELFPSDQLDAYPVTERAYFLASVLLTPLNLAWTTQLVMLVGLTTFASDPGPGAVLAVLTCLGYVVAATFAGQAIGWWVVGLRQGTWGRRLTWTAATVIGATIAVVVLAGRTADVLDAAPTTWIVLGATSGAAGGYARWALVTATLVVAAVVGFALARRACAWSLRRPRWTGGTPETRPVRRRGPARSVLAERLAVDRASVWRSVSLRRGLIVLGVIPGAVAAAAGLEWSTLVLLPGLVAAGAGLLFGVNAFCLDGGGTVWLASVPGADSVQFRAKAQIVGEVCATGVLIAVLGGVWRAGGAPTAAEVVALLACTVVTVARVMAVCMRWSVVRPHRADLRGPRDTPAPPGVMAAYSVRLAVSTTLVAVLFSGIAELGSWRLAVGLAVPFLLLSARHLLVSARLWADASVRARVVATVAAG